MGLVLVQRNEMEWLGTLALAMGAAWVSGIRLYAVVATLGWLGKLGYAQLPGELVMLTNPWVIGVSTGLFVIEFVADKVAYVDSVWDAVQTFIRIPAGAVLAAAAFTEFDPTIQVVAGLVGGGLALTSHGTKTTARLVVNASPEPVSNVAVSTAEDVVGGLGLALALLVPILAVFFVTGLTIASWFILPKVYRRIKERARRTSSQREQPRWSSRA